MLLVGESINIMSKTIGPAMRKLEAGPVQKMAVDQTEAGVDYLDLNIGPAKKGGVERMEWLVKTVQEVSDLPLFLDTTNVDAIEAGLKIHRGRAVINSISCRPERMDALLPLVKEYECDFVALLVEDLIDLLVGWCRVVEPFPRHMLPAPLFWGSYL